MLWTVEREDTGRCTLVCEDFSASMPVVCQGRQTELAEIGEFPKHHHAPCQGGPSGTETVEGRRGYKADGKDGGNVAVMAGTLTRDTPPEPWNMEEFGKYIDAIFTSSRC